MASRDPSASRAASSADRRRARPRQHTPAECPRPSSSARSGATRARARSSTCSPRNRTSSAATRAGRTPGTRSSSTARRSRSGRCRAASSRASSSVIGAGCVVDPQVLRRRARRARRARHRPVGRRPLRQRAPDHAVARRDRPGVGAAARLAADRDDAPRDRPGVRRQGLADRHPRAGRARPEDPAPEDRGRARREEPLARADLRVGAVRPRGGVVAVRRATPSGSRRSSATSRCSSTTRCASGKHVLFEGAQATLLDLDHGTYPFVTSSNPIASGAATGIGIGPTRIDRVLGVSKAYVTRVGEGPFPSEIVGPDQERLRELGGEFGTVTGRERRCGWLDLVALRYAVRVNGMTSLALTKLDVLSAFDELPVCVRYRLRDGSETEHFPAHQSDFHHADAGVGDAARLVAAARRRGLARRAAGRRAARTSSSSHATSRCRSSSSVSAPRASASSRDRRGLAEHAWTQIIVGLSIFVPVVGRARPGDPRAARREGRPGRAALAPPRRTAPRRRTRRVATGEPKCNLSSPGVAARPV